MDYHKSLAKSVQALLQECSGMEQSMGRMRNSLRQCIRALQEIQKVDTPQMEVVGKFEGEKENADER
jgi:hypothetical protein